MEWFKNQSEYNKSVYERLQRDYGDLEDWKVTVVFYSGLHRVNYHLCARTGRVPKNHAERNRWLMAEMPRVFLIYKDLYTLSMRARYCDGFRISDAHRKRAASLLDQLEKELPFS